MPRRTRCLARFDFALDNQVVHGLRRKVARTALDAGNRNSTRPNARQRRELTVNELGAPHTPENRPRRLAATKCIIHTEIHGTAIPVRVALLSQPTLAKMLPNIYSTARRGVTP